MASTCGRSTSRCSSPRADPVGARPLIAVGGQAFGGADAALAIGADIYATDPEALLRELAVRF